MSWRSECEVLVRGFWCEAHASEWCLELTSDVWQDRVHACVLCVIDDAAHLQKLMSDKKCPQEKKREMEDAITQVKSWLPVRLCYGTNEKVFGWFVVGNLSMTMFASGCG